MSWGDSIPDKINSGLRNSRFILICLSKHFLKRPWPEAELASAIATQNSNGVKCVLPLILNGKSRVFKRYPLLRGLAYRHFSIGVSGLVDDLKMVLGGEVAPDEFSLRITVESAHSGEFHEFILNSRASVEWLSRECNSRLGISDYADTGGFVKFRLKWVLVDVDARTDYLAMPRAEQRKLRAIVKTDNGISICRNGTTRLSKLGVRNGTVFRLHAVEDEKYYEEFADGAAECAAEESPAEACAEPEAPAE